MTMISFKQFLLEGGNATAKFGISRANSDDIEKAIQFVSKVLDIPENTLRENLIGSTRLTLNNIEIKKLPNAQEIIKKCKESLNKLNIPIPTEL